MTSGIKKERKLLFLFTNASDVLFILMFTKNVDLITFKFHKCNFVTKNNIALYFIYALKLII
ncbi:hypothetical protein DLH84_14080 [Vibrio parahaemolyticus]|nr:hypothetical protein [Vibrio parahaemolyticus]EGR1247517.1 hypothetical protein [Vibrio parahaemolyticus]EGR1550401.1 hypothetical protein [Vibrio parahaemolyticus]EGR2089074.1 hypothetical protein [Vibrio parahaemolyticus]EGR2108684.1 hypothetical protein [Vibrio parahaemolyticus]